MIGLIIIISLIALTFALIKWANRNSELSGIQSQIAKEDHRKKMDNSGIEELNARYQALEKIKKMLDQGTLTNEEYDSEKRWILASKVPSIAQAVDAGESTEQKDSKELETNLESLGFRVVKEGEETWSVMSPSGKRHLIHSKLDLTKLYESASPQNN